MKVECMRGVTHTPCMDANEEAEHLRDETQAGEQAGKTHQHQPLEHEVSPREIAKWREMLGTGIDSYMHAHPDRFHRRVRRGIPPSFRWQVWKEVVRLRSSEQLGEEAERPNYDSLCTRENDWTACIEIDISRTFPELKIFDADQQQRLLRVLNAYANYNPDVGYCQGMNFVAGLLLLVSRHEEESFNLLRCLMDYPQFGLSGFYRDRLPLLRRYLRACDKLVAETVPELREHFIRENVQPAMYLHQWFLTLFINCFPLSMVLIIWDVIVCEGLPVILRIAVSILQALKDSLLTMSFEDIIKFFKMMKKYDDEEGELNASRIGQLLMQHTEHVVISEKTLEYLRDHIDDDGNPDSDESWEQEINGGGWLQSITRMFTFGARDWRSRSTPTVSQRAAPTPDATPSSRQCEEPARSLDSGKVPAPGRRAGGTDSAQPAAPSAATSAGASCAGGPGHEPAPEPEDEPEAGNWELV